ncbi:unnamed protein product [Agarophyton chilense]
MARGRRSRVRRHNNSNKRPSPQPTQPTQPTQPAQRAGEQHLIDHFQQDVRTPLQSRPDRPVAASAKPNTPVSLELPDRTQTLNLLVKGAWIGIGILAGVFVLVHFVIVKDFLPK